MRTRTYTASASALLLIAASLVDAKHGAHEHLQSIHAKHRAKRELLKSTPEYGELGIEIRGVSTELPTSDTIEKRGGQCQFPTDAGLVSVSPGQQNAGWAMSPDQPCKPGNYCPYACPPGQVSMQWDPSATSYTYPQSMNGGLFCDSNGNIQKPFPDKPYCQSTSSNIGVINNAGSVVSFCQTVLPGNEAMLIPTACYDSATLANPGPDYWAGTAAHYYINPPGISTDQACVWGTNQNPVGNWSPYVAGANTDSSGNTFIKLGWNPIYLENATPFRNTMPNWGVKIDCPNGGCNGLPCAIDPTQNHVNQMQGAATDGAGGAAFCVVTVSKGSTANFVVFQGSEDSTSSNSPSSWSNTGWGAKPSGSGKPGQFYGSTTGSPSSTSWISSTSSSTSYTSSRSRPTSTGYWSKGNGTTSASSTSPSETPRYGLFNTTGATTTSFTSQSPTATSSTISTTTKLPNGGTAQNIHNPLGWTVLSSIIFWLTIGL